MKFTCTTVETQRDFLDVGYKISFRKNMLWTGAEILGGIACIAYYSLGNETYFLPCGIGLLALGLISLTWPFLRAIIGYNKALKTYGGQMKPSHVTFTEDEIINETPNGTMKCSYADVKTIHFLTHSFVIEDKRGVGFIVSKNGFGDVDFMDCVNFLCEKCENLEL